jgi:hypothetical protein
MAKCVRVVGQGVPVRMSDEDAFQVVERDHDGEYCSKNVWCKLSLPEPGRIVRLSGNKIVEAKTLARQDQVSRKGW